MKKMTIENFSAVKFEKLIPHKMRYKQYDVTEDGILYWVTQEMFTNEDVETFKNALKTAGFEKAYLIVRDYSAYDLETDIASGNIQTITAE